MIVHDKIWNGTERAYLGGILVNSRKLVHMFFKTLIYGGLAGLLTSFIVKWGGYANFLQPFVAIELLGVFLFFFGYDLVFTVVVYTGFFFYLFVCCFVLVVFFLFILFCVFF